MMMQDHSFAHLHHLQLFSSSFFLPAGVLFYLKKKHFAAVAVWLLLIV